MPVYAKKTLVTSPRFAGRVNTIAGFNSNANIMKAINGDLSEARMIHRTSVPDNLVLCNGCNSNIAEAEVIDGQIPFGYLVYLGKRELKADQPYDIYCKGCLDRLFPKAVNIDG